MLFILMPQTHNGIRCTMGQRNPGTRGLFCNQIPVWQLAIPIWQLRWSGSRQPPDSRQFAILIFIYANTILLHNALLCL